MDMFNYQGPPFYYDYKNAYNAQASPSTVHCKNTALQMYYSRYLLKKAISVYKWTLPVGWAWNYFIYVLYCFGWISVVNTDKFGAVPQACGLRGYDVQYQPTNAIITNPLLHGILEPRIGRQCSLIKLQPDYTGVLDRINFYADMLALSAETAAIDLVNSKLAYVFASEGKTASESFKKMFDSIASGEPAQFADKKLFNDDGSPAWMMFNQDLRSTYIAGNVLEDMRKWEMAFDTDFGIPNANTDKKERLTDDEVNIKQTESRTWGELALEEIRKGIEQTRDIFGFTENELNVEWRFREEVETDGESITQPDGPVSVPQ